jgi:hypothetical protein
MEAIKTQDTTDPRHIGKVEAKGFLARWQPLFSSYSDGHVYDSEVEKAVKDYNSGGGFSQWSSRVDESVVVDWCILGLDWILGDTGNQVGVPQTVEKAISDWKRRSVDVLSEELEDAIKEASDEQRAEWEHDPEDFRKWNRKDLDECEHPWCDETITLTRLWLSLHPFEWFILHNHAEEWGFDVVRENLRAYAFESEDSKNVGEEIRKRLCETMEKWVKRVEDGRW